jgi:hypothetical protein
MAPGQQELSHGQVKADHLVAQPGQLTSDRNTTAAADIEYPRSWLQPAVEISEQRCVWSIHRTSGVVSGSRLVVAAPDEFSSVIAERHHGLDSKK